MIYKLKDFPELLRIIHAVDPEYRKHNVIVNVVERMALGGTYWSGGSRVAYTAVNLLTMQSSGAPQFSPPQFGGPATDPVVAVPEGVAIVSTGTFCGKKATASVYLNPANVEKLLPC